MNASVKAWAVIERGWIVDICVGEVVKMQVLAQSEWKLRLFYVLCECLQMAWITIFYGTNGIVSIMSCTKNSKFMTYVVLLQGECQSQTTKVQHLSEFPQPAHHHHCHLQHKVLPWPSEDTALRQNVQ